MAQVRVPIGRGPGGGIVYVQRHAPIQTPDKYRTFEARLPIKTHFVDASCEAVDCEQYRCGWSSTFDLSTELGQKQADYCQHDKTRSFSVQRPGPSLIVFVYPPGNKCFRKHKAPVQRPPILLAFRGDFRGQLSQPQVHSRVEDWVDQCQTNLDAIRTVQERG